MDSLINCSSFFQISTTVTVGGKNQVYTITDDSLPSHMRSLLPSHEQHVHDLLTLERTRRRLRRVILVLSLLLVLAVFVALTLIFTLKVKAVDMEIERDSARFGLASAQEVSEVGFFFFSL
jgi:hypothetical protein